jgi:hypothetical protein
MRDYLKEYCKNQNIKLKYTKNKSAVLSIGNEKDVPSIRIHKMFKNSTEDSASKIIKYYEFYQSSYSVIKFIQDYVQQYYKTIDSPGWEFGNLFAETSTKNTIQIRHSKQIIKKEKSSNESTFFNEPYHDRPDKMFKNDKSCDLNDDDIYIKKHLRDTKVVDVIITKSNSIMFTFKPQKRSALHGIVKLPDGKAAKNALVKLFQKQNKSEELSPVSFKFTDERGEFSFELPPGEYVLKVFYYDMSIN